MQHRSSRLKGWAVALVIALVVLILPAHGQDNLPSLAVPKLKPMVKMTGFINATPSATNVYPIVTLKLPGEEKFYTFLLTEMKVMAGPLRTSESILSEVKPFKPNFHVRTSREITARLVTASPTEQLTFLALYSQSDRVLVIENFVQEDGGSQ
jgi:hypothetical protein